MVGSTLAIRSKMASPSAAMQLSSLSRRSLSTRPQVLRSTRSLRQQQFQRSARRSYADAAPASSPAPKPKKRFRFLRWTWRLTWLSSVAMAGALAYSVYELRHPVDQVIPDSEKKTLVILGRLFDPVSLIATRSQPNINSRATSFRYRMGNCFPAEEARH